MVRSIVIAGVLAVVVALPAHAQNHFEASVTGGYTFSEGVSGDVPFVTPSGTFTGITVKSGPSVGVSFAVITKAGGEVGFQWGRQMSKLGVTGVPSFELGDMNIDQYHVNFAYNALPGAKTRPYLSIGFGATDYGAVAYSTANRTGEVAGPVKFSFKIGVGVKSWFSNAVGLRAGANWIPTAISSHDSGYWCDPYFGCYVGTTTTFSHQLELAGGVVFRFGGE